MGRRDLVSREYGDSAAQADGIRAVGRAIGWVWRTLGRVGGFAYRRSVGRP